MKEIKLETYRSNLQRCTALLLLLLLLEQRRLALLLLEELQSLGVGERGRAGC